MSINWLLLREGGALTLRGRRRSRWLRKARDNAAAVIMSAGLITLALVLTGAL